MIIDVFTFYNEIELLEFHINHVKDYVDKIIVIEGDRTYTGKPYKSRFNIKDPKVEHHIVPLLEAPDDRWENEALQRYLAGEIAKKYAGTIFFECADEILKPEMYKEYDEPQNFILDNYYYYFNGKDTINSAHPMPIAIPSHLITDLHFQWTHRSSFNQVPNAGWHFSYLGGAERIKEKLGAYSHSENDTDEIKKDLKENIESGNDIFGRQDHHFEYVLVDNSFPEELVKNQEKYKGLIK